METTDVVRDPGDRVAGRAGRRRGRAAGATRSQLEVPEPSEGFEQAVLSVDPHGVTTWSFAPRPTRGKRGRRTAGPRDPDLHHPSDAGRTAAHRRRRRSVDLRRGRQAAAQGHRLPCRRRRGPGGQQLPGHWERAHQGYGIRDYTTDSYTGPRPLLRRRHRALGEAGDRPHAPVHPTARSAGRAAPSAGCRSTR